MTGTVLAAATGLPCASATILSFPTERFRNSDAIRLMLKHMGEIGIILQIAQAFRGIGDEEAGDKVRKIMEGSQGVDRLSSILEDTRALTTSLRSVATDLADIDRLIASAADRVLAEAGI